MLDKGSDDVMPMKLPLRFLQTSMFFVPRDPPADHPALGNVNMTPCGRS